MKVVVMTSDKYIHAVRPFLYLFDRYWRNGSKPASPDVVVAGFSTPEFDLPDWARFLSIGNFADYPWNRWSDGLLRLLDLLESDEPFVLMLEDYWLVRQVDTIAVQVCYEYMRQFQYVLKFDLCADRLYAQNMTEYGHAAHVDIVKSHHQSPYHMSLMTGLWNPQLLRRFLIPNESPHDVELTGTHRLAQARDKVLVLGTRQWPVRHTLAFRAQNPSALNLVDLEPHDVEAMTRQGLLEPWGVRYDE